MQYLGSEFPFFRIYLIKFQFKTSAIVAKNQKATTAASAIYIRLLKVSLIKKRRRSRSKMEILVIDVIAKYSTDVENVILV
jgi:hypothetical protein